MVKINGLGKSFLQTLISDREIRIGEDNSMFKVVDDLLKRGIVSWEYCGHNQLRVKLIQEEGGILDALQNPENNCYAEIFIRRGIVGALKEGVLFSQNREENIWGR